MINKSKTRYGIVVFFEDGGWNVFCQETKDGWINEHYFTSDEDDLDQALNTLELFLGCGGNYWEYKVPSYDEFNKAVANMLGYDCDAAFELPNKVIEGLERYLTSSNVPHFPATNATNCSNCGCDILENEYCLCPKCHRPLIFEINTM